MISKTISKICVVGLLAFSMQVQIAYAQQDSTKSVVKANDEEEDWHDDLMPEDTSQAVHENFARQIVIQQKNSLIPVADKDKKLFAMDYMMNDGRYIGNGETFTKKWYDHLYLQGGLGVEYINKAVSNYGVHPFTQANVALGKQFGPIHSFRLNGSVGFAFVDKTNKNFYKFGLNLSYLYSFSSFLFGYNPSRVLDISGVLTVGGNLSKLKTDHKFSYYGRAGLQFKFFTGPQGYIALEPYIGISSDQIDVSYRHNWRKHDVFYGATLNYIWYLRNNLSPQSRYRFINGRYRNSDFIAKDSTLRAWHTKFFVEYANGISFLNSPTMNFWKTRGLSTSLSIGYWLSPAIAVRLTGMASDNTYLEESVANGEGIYRAVYNQVDHNHYTAVRVDGLLNPFAFTRRFHWNNSLGVYLMAGLELGWVNKYSQEDLKCYNMSYVGGLHFYKRLIPGLQLFFEPTYTHRVYRIPYNNVSRNQVFNDNYLDLRLGITVQPIYKYTGENKDKIAVYKLRHFVIGAGGGLYHIWKNQEIGRPKHVPYNVNIFGEYHFDDIWSTRANFEMFSTCSNGMLSYTDYTTKTGMAESPVSRVGLWKITRYYGIASVSALANMKNLFCGITYKHHFTLEAFLGPSLFFNLGHTAEINEGEIYRENHQLEYEAPEVSKVKVGGHIGLKLLYRINPTLDVFFTPTFYMWDDDSFQNGYHMKLNLLQTFNLGLQVKL